MARLTRMLPTARPPEGALMKDLIVRKAQEYRALAVEILAEAVRTRRTTTGRPPRGTRSAGCRTTRGRARASQAGQETAPWPSRNVYFDTLATCAGR